MNAPQLTLLTKPVSSKQCIEATYRDITVSQGLPPATAFSIALPFGWTLDSQECVPPPGPEHPLVPLARFRPTVASALGRNLNAEVVVWAAFLPREMHGCDWLWAWVKSQGYERLDSREASTAFGIMGDALVLCRADGSTRLHRLTTIKDGDLLFLIDGRARFAPDISLESVQELFLMAVIRFHLLQATKQVFAEGFEPVVLSGSAAVRFLASGLWTQRPGTDAPAGGASLILDNVVDQTVLGTMIAVLGMPGTPAGDIEAVTLKKLINQGITFTARTKPQYDDIEPGWEIVVRSATATRNGGSLTVVSARITLESIPLSLVLVSPSESAAFEAWAINRRALGIALDSMEVKLPS